MIDNNEICPGVRKTVQWLNKNHFNTTDSGDGSHYKDGMECALPYPNIFMVVSCPFDLVWETNRLYILLKEKLKDKNKDYVLQADYSPIDGTAIIHLLHISDKDLNI